MSTADTRAQLAAAMTSVDGVNGYPRRPGAARPGDSWPLWRGSARADGAAYEETWVVVLVVPADEAAADDFIDDRIDAIDAALRPLLYVDSYTPATLPTEGGDLFALMITGRTE